MAAESVTSPRTLGDLCPEARREIERFVRGTSKDESSRLPRGILWRMVSRRVGKSVDKVLDTPIEQILERGWTLAKRVRACKDEAPDKPFEIILGKHTITSVHEPSLEVEIDDHHIGRLDFHVEIVVQLGGVSLSGKNGCIERAAPRECSVAGDFACKTTIYGVSETFPAKIDPIRLPFGGDGILFERPIPIP